MTYSHYGWSVDGPLPVLENHSRAKHEILRGYLAAYVQTLLSNPNRGQFSLTLVDGFCGGGLYQGEKPGSPLSMLEALREAEALVNTGRQKPIRFEVDYFFIDADPGATGLLTKVLKARGYEPRIGKDIHVWNAPFDSKADQLIEHIKRRMPRSGRAIFLLDQYGYSEVPTEIIRRIMKQMPSAEVILTFNVASLLTYISDKKGQAEAMLSSAGTPDSLKGRSITNIKLNEGDWRLFIQACMCPELVRNCGAPFYTLFFIRSEQGHGDYWLVHFSQHARARDVMTRIHWEKSNFFIHYGGAGLDMFEGLGYAASLDANVTDPNQSRLGFEFGEREREDSIKALMEQIPRLVYSAPEEAVVFGEMFATHCNMSPAHAELHREAIARLRNERQVEVVRDRRVTASKIQDGDLIRRPIQTSMKW
ncbi:MAG TPA: three-Cys-motif partner protein TcmP [Nevskia sp.]|nr:three-Cys-motif partner protein TcmP [Nevskia sp.]